MSILYATAQLAPCEIDNLSGKLILETGRWLQVKQSNCLTSTKTSRWETLGGQLRGTRTNEGAKQKPKPRGARVQ